MEAQQPSAREPPRVQRRERPPVLPLLQLAGAVAHDDELGVPAIRIEPVISVFVGHRSERISARGPSDAAVSVPLGSFDPTRPWENTIAGYADWLRDFERRLALHDEGVMALAHDLAVRTNWSVAAEAPGFPPPAPRAGRAPDVLCERGAETPPVAFEVELPETLVRRDTVRRLATLVDGAVETRVALIADDEDHADTIREAGRLLRCAGLEIRVVAISPRTAVLTGADW